MNPKFVHCFLVSVCCSLHGATPLFPRFKAVEIDSHVDIGYGVTVADVDGDGKPDILLADKKQIRVGTRTPTWKRFVIAENLTPLDDVCIAAADVDGTGKASIAVGAQWNPGDTVNSGAVFYLIPPADRTQKWEAVELPHEPTVHRMRWMRTGTGFVLVVAPLHGRGNQGGQGEGVRILSYQKPADPHRPWKTEVVNSSLHMTHNFELLKSADTLKTGMFVAAKEGVFELLKDSSSWSSHQIVGPTLGDTQFAGAGEVRSGRRSDGGRFFGDSRTDAWNQPGSLYAGFCGFPSVCGKDSCSTPLCKTVTLWPAAIYSETGSIKSLWAGAEKIKKAKSGSKYFLPPMGKRASGRKPFSMTTPWLAKTFAWPTSTTTASSILSPPAAPRKI